MKTTKKEFIVEDNPREEARWKAAHKELRDQGIIEQDLTNNDIFALTHRGYIFYDQLKKDRLLVSASEIEQQQVGEPDPS